MSKIPVILNHDAAIDEYMATVLLTTMEQVDLRGIVVTNADCIADPAMSTAWKIQSFIGRQDIGLSLSGARGYNPFPWSYRGDCIKEGAITPLQFDGPHPGWPPYPDGERHLTELLEKAEESSVILLVTCPLTTLQLVLSARPELAGKVKQMIWMGGAIDVAGNLDPTTVPPSVANPYAEWNAFWDPMAVDWVFRSTDFPVVLFPLDVTNSAVISKDFLAAMEAQGKSYRFSNLAYESYELVANEAFYDMWDVVTTCFITRPDLFEPPSPMELEIVIEGANQGAIRRAAGGRKVDVVLKLKDIQAFYDFVLESFRR